MTDTCRPHRVLKQVNAVSVTSVHVSDWFLDYQQILRVVEPYGAEQRLRGVAKRLLYPIVEGVELTVELMEIHAHFLVAVHTKPPMAFAYGHTSLLEVIQLHYLVGDVDRL